MEFYYHKSGPLVGDLDVAVRRAAGSEETTVWSKSTPSVGDWVQALVDIDMTDNFQVDFSNVYVFPTTTTTCRMLKTFIHV